MQLPPLQPAAADGICQGIQVLLIEKATKRVKRRDDNIVPVSLAANLVKVVHDDLESRD